MYTLREVVSQTKIPKQTLYAWERRYDIVTPKRTDSNRRLYTQEDIYRLTLLAKLVASGERIGNLVTFSIADLESMERAGRPREEGSVADYIRTIRTFDQPSLDRMLATSFLASGPAHFVHETVFPVLREIGRLWYVGDIPAAAEHLFSASVRNLLGLAMNQGPAQSTDSRALFSTLSGEPHELGLLAAAVAAKANGFDTTYLGPQLPPGEIAGAAQALRADIVCISVTSMPVSSYEEQIQSLIGLLPRRSEIWVGGHANIRNVCRDPCLQFFDDLIKFERSLRIKSVSAHE